MTHATGPILFGLHPIWVASGLLLITYAVIMTEKINRAIVALIGASLMIAVGVLDQAEALKGVDWNTLGLLTGMMIIVSISSRSGMFQYLAVRAAQAAKARPSGILLLLQVTTALLSALLGRWRSHDSSMPRPIPSSSLKSSPRISAAPRRSLATHRTF